MFGPWILGRMTTWFLSASTQDGSIFIWMFRWWPHAITPRNQPAAHDRCVGAHGDQPGLGHLGAAPRRRPVAGHRGLRALLLLQPGRARRPGAGRVDRLPAVPASGRGVPARARRRLLLRLLALPDRRVRDGPSQPVAGLPGPARRLPGRAAAGRLPARAPGHPAARRGAGCPALHQHRDVRHADPDGRAVRADRAGGRPGCGGGGSGRRSARSPAPTRWRPCWASPCSTRWPPGRARTSRSCSRPSATAPRAGATSCAT